MKKLQSVIIVEQMTYAIYPMNEKEEEDRGGQDSIILDSTDSNL